MDSTLSLQDHRGSRGGSRLFPGVPRALSFGRTLAIAGSLIAALIGPSAAQAGLVASFETALQPGAPAAGWSFLWNSGGALGSAGNYTPLVATGDPVFWYDSNGIPGVPDPNPAGFVFFGKSLGLSLGHPGRGAGQPEGLGGASRYAIAAYTLPQSGHVALTGSQLVNRDRSTDGLDLRIYVNDDLKGSGTTPPGLLSSIGFDTDLGSLAAGDVVYVAVGPRAVDFFDTFALRYTIHVPEPGTAALAILGLLAAGLARRGARPMCNEACPRTGDVHGTLR